jgi:hypothetical protein
MQEIKVFTNTRLLAYQYGVLKALKKLKIEPKHLISDEASFINIFLYTNYKLLKKYYEGIVLDKKKFLIKNLNFKDYIFNDYYLEVELQGNLIYQSQITPKDFNRFLNYNFKKKYGQKEEDYFLADLNLDGEKHILRLARDIQKYDKEYLIDKAYYETLKYFKKIEGNTYYFHNKELDKFYNSINKKYIDDLLKYIRSDDSLEILVDKIPYISNILKDDNKDYFFNLIENTANIFKLNNSKLYTINKFNENLKNTVYRLSQKKHLTYNKLNSVNSFTDEEIITIICKCLNMNIEKIINIIKKYPVHFLSALYLELI